MKTSIWAIVMATLVAVTLAPDVSEAKRLGGGKSLGMQRSAPPANPSAPGAGPNANPNATPATPAANPGAAAAPTAGAAAAAPKRSWMGPLAGLAAGLGIAALMSHFGMGEAFGNFLMLALLAVVAVVAIRFLMTRFGRGASAGSSPGLQLAGAGVGTGMGRVQSAPSWPQPAGAAPRIDEPMNAGLAPAAVASGLGPAAVPAGFDSEGFERIAKMIFIRLQAANDKGDLNDLRNFTTPEMFASIRLDLQDRGAATQQTDVVKVDAQVIEVASEAERQLVSVRFHGLIREDLDGPAHDFDEIWHLSKATGASDSAWAIAGIQQRQ